MSNCPKGFNYSARISLQSTSLFNHRCNAQGRVCYMYVLQQKDKCEKGIYLRPIHVSLINNMYKMKKS